MNDVFVLMETDDLSNPRGIYGNLEDARFAAEELIKKEYKGTRTCRDDVEIPALFICKVAMNCLLNDFYELEMWRSSEQAI